MPKHDINSLPKSLSEAKSIGHTLYYTGRVCKYGHLTYRYVQDRICADCAREKVRRAATTGGGNARRWAAKTPEQREAINSRRREYYRRTRDARLAERQRSYATLSKDKEWLKVRREKSAAYRKANGRKPDLSNPEVKRRYKQTPHGRVKVRAGDAKRHAAKMQRTPKWLTDDDFWVMEQAYELAALRTKVFGFSWHVDHVIPLQGTEVSGLHVPQNLQVIPWIDNVRKANKLTTSA